MSARRHRSERHEQISDTTLLLLRRCGGSITDLAASLGQDRTNKNGPSEEGPFSLGRPDSGPPPW